MRELGDITDAIQRGDLGPGLLEFVYEAALARALEISRLLAVLQVPVRPQMERDALFIVKRLR